MYTVLIAEDEILVRLGIISSIPWVRMGMQVVAEAANGLAAWEAYEKYHPDIVITDIRMPGLDGLDLLRRIRAQGHDCAVIVVTNVEQGAAVEEVLRMGVADCLLKAIMTQEDMQAALQKAVQSLPDRPMSPLDRADQASLWRELLLEASLNYESFLRLCEKKGEKPFPAEGFILLRFFPEDRLSVHLRTSMTDLIAHRLGSPDEMILIEMTDGMLMLTKRCKDAGETARIMIELARYIRMNFGVRIAIVVQEECTGFHALLGGFQRAMQYVKESELFDRPVLMLDAGGVPAFDALDKAQEALKCYARLLSDEIGHLPDLLDGFLSALPQGWERIRERGKMALLCAGEGASFEGLHELVRRLTSAIQRRIEALRADIRPEILNVVEYAESHLDENLSIYRMSEIAHFHPAYLSNLFKREIGISYSDYITEVRIARAKHLLSGTDMTLQEIADQCGFSSLSYFCYRFKCAVGVSPGQWRA